MDEKKTVLVTGGAGFIGSHLCGRLLKDGHTVISLDNYFTGSKANHIIGVDYREGHTKDIELHVPETPDVVYHLGEYSRVERSIYEPVLVWDLNIAGTFGVLEHWRKRKYKLVYAGSSTKFGDGGAGRSQSPYAWTKATNTELVKNYSEWYKLAYAITYFYNVYGPGERAGQYGTVIEIFRKQYSMGDPLTVVSPGTQKRNFTHVDDIVEGLMLVGEKGYGDDHGLGVLKEYSILEVAQMFSKKIAMLPERPGNRLGSSIDTSKSEKLGWHAAQDLETYVKNIVKKGA
ncbi:MAG: NAD-dependent epimerase/dehydratase family protein [Patescibacteria group bacterium]